jgi:hypothetical protein
VQRIADDLSGAAGDSTKATDRLLWAVNAFGESLAEVCGVVWCDVVRFGVVWCGVGALFECLLRLWSDVACACGGHRQQPLQSGKQHPCLHGDRLRVLLPPAELWVCHVCPCVLL